MKNKVFRFDGWMRFFHWGYITAYLILALTGAFLYFNFLDGLQLLFGGIQGARLVHRITAVALIAIPIVVLLVRPKEVIGSLKYAYSWTARDLAFFKEFPKEFFGGHAHFDPQGKFNQGEKLNIVLQSSGWVLFVVSGLLLWFFDKFSATVGMYAMILHDIAFIATFMYAIGHIYMGLFHPITKQALPAMVSGYMDADFAKEHYTLWYNEVTRKGKSK